MNISSGYLIIFLSISLIQVTFAQSFYFGADQSYVNEMEDCGATFTENREAKDVYDIYQDHGNNLVRLRLWHTPSWYDNLNEGKRYSDLQDVTKSIKRAKAHGMDILLDFHLSDNWADPGKQLVPNAWLSVVDNLPLLQDSLYNYIYKTLEHLNKESALPEMVQIGNETNKGILLSPEDNQGWTLDWDRNQALFNKAISAVRTFCTENEEDIKIMLHIAAPDNAGWLSEQFHENGVTDFDIIGLSYYWAWHKPTSIEETANVIKDLKQTYNKEVMIVETGYIWTNASNDNAGNIISEVHPDYSPASPENQKAWLIDLTKKVIESGGIGVCYWEPSWVSTSCSTQWGQGSHQEHATFFDFDNNLLIPGGIEWMEYDYGLLSSNEDVDIISRDNIQIKSFQNNIQILINDFDFSSNYQYQIIDTTGRLVIDDDISSGEEKLGTSELSEQIYIIRLIKDNVQIFSQKIWVY